jgi:hypothetical protein
MFDIMVNYSKSNKIFISFVKYNNKLNSKLITMKLLVFKTHMDFFQYFFDIGSKNGHFLVLYIWVRVLYIFMFTSKYNEWGCLGWIELLIIEGPMWVVNYVWDGQHGCNT